MKKTHMIPIEDVFRILDDAMLITYFIGSQIKKEFKNPGDIDHYVRGLLTNTIVETKELVIYIKEYNAWCDTHPPYPMMDRAITKIKDPVARDKNENE